MSLRLQFLIVTLLAVIMAAGWWSYDSWGGAEAAKKSRRAGTTLVLVDNITLMDDRITLRLVGTGKAARLAALHSAVSGKVTAIKFKPQQQVRKGQALIRLDDTHQRLKVQLADVAVTEASRQFQRMQKLAPLGHAAKYRLDAAQAVVDMARIRLQQAKAELRDRTIFAPFAGIVGMTGLNLGDRVTEGTMAVTLDDRSEIIVEFNVPEAHAGKIALGDAVAVKPWSQSDQLIAGTISAMASRIDRTTRSLTMQARIPNQKDQLRPGGSFEVQIDFTGKAYPMVREVAVLWSRDGAYLWRIKDGKADKVFVRMVRRDRGRVLVDGPLAAGDLVVVEGVQGLRLGQKVKTAPFKANFPKASNTSSAS